MQSFIFKNSVKWTEDRRAKLFSEGKTLIEISSPPEFEGPKGYWSPEELFLASINSCIMTTFFYFVKKFSLSFLSYESKVLGEVKFNSEEGRYSFSSVKVSPIILVENPEEKEKAEKAIGKAEKYCLISASVRSNIDVSPEVEIVKR